jgi:hypothetical protein
MCKVSRPRLNTTTYIPVLRPDKAKVQHGGRKHEIVGIPEAPTLGTEAQRKRWNSQNKG